MSVSLDDLGARRHAARSTYTNRFSSGIAVNTWGHRVYTQSPSYTSNNRDTNAACTICNEQYRRKCPEAQGFGTQDESEKATETFTSGQDLRLARLPRPIAAVESMLACPQRDPLKNGLRLPDPTPGMYRV